MKKCRSSAATHVVTHAASVNEKSLNIAFSQQSRRSKPKRGLVRVELGGRITILGARSPLNSCAKFAFEGLIQYAVKPA